MWWSVGVSVPAARPEGLPTMLYEGRHSALLILLLQILFRHKSFQPNKVANWLLIQLKSWVSRDY